MKVTIGDFPGPKSKRERRIDVRIDKFDTWNMDATLALIILPMLKQLKETKHGSPIVDDDDVPEDLRRVNQPPTENDWDADDAFFRRWDWVLDEMIWAFEMQYFHDEGHNLYYDPFDPENPEHQKELVENVIDPAFMTPDQRLNLRKEIGVFNREKFEVYNHRVKSAFTLFGKYYTALWD